MFLFNHHHTLSSWLYCNFFFRKSIATFCSPICAYSAWISPSLPSSMAFSSLSNTAEDLFKNSFFHALICVGCKSNFLLNASMVCCSLIASMHTFALNSAVNLRRLVLLISTGLILQNYILITCPKNREYYRRYLTTSRFSWGVTTFFQ